MDSSRGIEIEELIQKRLRNTKDELEHETSNGFFDHILVNDDLEAVYEQGVFTVFKSQSLQDDNNLLTACGDHSIKVWDSQEEKMSSSFNWTYWKCEIHQCPPFEQWHFFEGFLKRYATASARSDGMFMLCSGRDTSCVPLADAYGLLICASIALRGTQHSLYKITCDIYMYLHLLVDSLVFIGALQPAN